MHAGLVLPKALYDSKNVLLLASGKKLTQDMVAALKLKGEGFAFLGEVGERVGDGRSLTTLKDDAERAGQDLKGEFDRILTAQNLDCRPTGPPIREAIRAPRREPRKPAELAEVRAAVDDADSLVEEIAGGWIHQDEVAGAALATAEKFAGLFSADPSLAALMAQAKRPGGYLFAHSVNVSLLSMQIASAMGYGHSQVVEAGLAALVQDLGMTMVPDPVAQKPARLTPVEMIDIQKHTYRGAYLIERFRGLPIVPRFVAMQCHERNDGSGYPRRRPKHLIHIFARIVAVADAYDSLITDRPWRPALHPYRAMESMIQGAHQGKFDADAMKGLLCVLALYPIGIFVRLSTGDTARVVHANGPQFTKPGVMILADSKGRACHEPTYRDLAAPSGVSVESVIETPLPGAYWAGF